MGVLGLWVLVWSRLSRYRSTILVVLHFWIYGYLIAYPFRTTGGSTLMFRTVSYYVYPRFSLSLMVGVAVRRLLETRRELQFSALLCAVLIEIQPPRMIAESDAYKFPISESETAACGAKTSSRSVPFGRDYGESGR